VEGGKKNQIEPSLEPDDLVLAPKKSLKAYFCAAALQGCLASQDEAVPVYTEEDLVERAYRLGDLMFQIYC
jgi:hypothetical protein